MDYKETIKERVKILPETLKSFVLDEKWRREAERIGKQFGFDEEKYASFENEVFLVLLCFEPRKDLAENIKKETGIDTNVAGWIAEDVNKNILSKVASELDTIEKQINENEGAIAEPKVEGENKGVGLVPRSDSGVGQSFEDIILNQARAMRPAVASSELGSGAAKPAVASSELGSGAAKPAVAPDNLPTGEQNQNEAPKKIQNYNGGDPYREPIS